jgi:predicted phage tail protein
LQAGATTNIVADSRSLNNLLLFADPNTAVVQPPSGVPGDGTGDGDSGTVITVPAEPNAPVATAGDRSARLQWTNNDDGGSSIIGHLVRVFEGTKLVKEVSVNARTDVTITGLKARTTYTFRIAAINSIGRSTFSPASNEVTPVRVVGKKIPKNSVQSASQARPGSARSVKTQVIGSRLSVSWRYAKQDVGTNVDFVILIRSNSGKIARLVVSDWQGVTLTGLERGTYNIRVRAFNSFGAARATKVIATRVR